MVKYEIDLIVISLKCFLLAWHGYCLSVVYRELGPIVLFLIRLLIGVEPDKCKAISN